MVDEPSICKRVITRIVVALLGLPFIIIPVWLGGIWIQLLLVCVALLAGVEFFNLLKTGGYQPVTWIGLPWLVLIVLSFAQPIDRIITYPISHLLTLPFLLTFGLMVTITYTLFQPAKPLLICISTIGGAVYLGMLIGEILALRFVDNGLWWFLLGLLITWANDTVAYFVGVWFGKNRLWPRLSPKKTWEGTISGWAGAALMSGCIAWLTPLPIHFGIGALLGAIGGILALFGDLSISMLKRQVGVKDSSALFPGHGGMLDRLDSILFVLPFLYHVVLIL